MKYGKDEVVKAEKLLNKEIEFEGYNPKIARIRVHKVHGAQFKCFVIIRVRISLIKLRSF